MPVVCLYNAATFDSLLDLESSFLIRRLKAYILRTSRSSSHIKDTRLRSGSQTRGSKKSVPHV